MLVHSGKYSSEDRLKTQTIQKLNTTQTKANNGKQNYPGSVAFYDTRPGNEVGLFYNDPEPTWGELVDIIRCNVSAKRFFHGITIHKRLRYRRQTTRSLKKRSRLTARCPRTRRKAATNSAIRAIVFTTELCCLLCQELEADITVSFDGVVC